MTKQSRNRRLICSDVKMEATIALDIVFSMGQGKVPRLNEEQLSHLKGCVACKESMRIWEEKGRTAFATTRAYDILNAASAGAPGILAKRVGNGTAYYKELETNPLKGTVVIASDEGVISDPMEQTLNEFERLS